MLLNIITGGLGSGKSSHLYNLISENLKNNPACEAILIVPEQFSYSAEKTLTDIMGGLGLNKIEVVTFSRLVQRYLKEQVNILSSGKRMLICKSVLKIDEDNMFFASSKKSGFIDSVSEIFSEFKRYAITPEDLGTVAADESSVSKKLGAVKQLYESYLGFFGTELVDSDDSLDRLAELISGSDIFKDTFFFIDDYNDFLPQHYSVIKAMIAKSRGVHITLCTDASGEDGIFAPVEKTKSRLIASAYSFGADLYEKKLDKMPEYIKSEDIRFLLESWDTPEKVYSSSCENIKLFTARDLYSEVERTASEIIRLVRDNDYRFRDIGIICGDINQYLHIMSAVFSDYGIPYFADEKVAVTMHPIVKTVLSLFNIILENWSYSSVFDYLRAGYIYSKDGEEISAVLQEDIDILENYVLLHGIRGKKVWFNEWTFSGETVFDDVIENRSFEEADLEKLNSLRRFITEPFRHFLENKGRTGKAISTAVFDFLCDINLYEGILYEAKQLSDAGKTDEAEQFKQIWNYIIETLDQLVLTTGDDVISRENFSLCFKSGLSQCMLSIIPSGIDRVSVGTIERNSPSRVKILFIIGASYGLIPKENTSSGIFSAYDRMLINSKLAAFDKELAPDSINRILIENFKLYRTISTATEQLYLSYPAAGSDGGTLNPAHFIYSVKKMFPDIQISDNIISKPSNEELLASSKRGFYYMLNMLSEYYRESPEKLWQEVFDWYSKNPEYADKLALLKSAAHYKKVQPMLSRAKAELLYGKNKKYSITALEKYSKCPFSYYMEKGLYAKPQEEKRIEKSHIGSLIHAAVCEFCKIVESGVQTVEEIRQKWTALSSDDCKKIISEVMAIMREKILARADNSKKQLDYLLSRCERTLKKSVETIRLSLSKGGYAAVCYEKDFEVKINWKSESVTLIGTIDRIDIMELINENKANIRIIDYKSGKKSFNVSAICNRLDMQLVLYAIAAAELYKSGKIEKTNTALSPNISGIFYNRVVDEFVTLANDDKELAKSMLLSNSKLDGVVVLDSGLDDNGESVLLPDNAFEMDSELADGISSNFMRVSLKKDNSFTANSQIESRENFELLESYMKKTVIKLDKSIKSGNIDIKPYKNEGDTACNFCNYKDACLFDSAFDNYRPLIKNAEKAQEYMKKEVEDDE